MNHLFLSCECSPHPDSIKVACRCSNRTVFLCDRCYQTHIHGHSGPYSFINEDKAIRDEEFNIGRAYNLDPQIYADLKFDIIQQIIQIMSFREALYIHKQQLTNSVDKAVEDNIRVLNEKEARLIERCRMISRDINKRSRQGREHLEEYRRNGICAILPEIPNTYILNENEARAAIGNSIRIEHHEQIKVENEETFRDSESSIRNTSMFEESKICSPVQLHQTPQRKLAKHREISINSRLSVDRVKDKVNIKVIPKIISEKEQKATILQQVQANQYKNIDLNQGLENRFKFEMNLIDLDKLGNKQVLLTKKSVYFPDKTHYDIPDFRSDFIFDRAALISDEFILIFGTKIFENRRILYKFSTSRSKVSEIEYLNCPRTNFSICSYRNYVYTIGGYINGQDSNIIERMKVSDSSWVKLKRVNNLARSNSVSWGVGDYILILDGYFKEQTECIDLMTLKSRKIKWNLSVDELFNIVETDEFVYILNGTAKLLFTKKLDYIGPLEPEENTRLLPKLKRTRVIT